MSTSLLYHVFAVRDYRHVRTKSGNRTIERPPKPS